MFFVDNLCEPKGYAVDQVMPDSDSELTQRLLNDGREFTIVKNYYDPEELQDAARAEGINLDVGNTSTFFQYGVGYAT